ncbi:MAG TPA: c-type cytochrome [Pyrinomonadaceae bacterium]|jgi:hypothetical protein
MKQKLKILFLLIFLGGSAFVFTQNGKMQTKQKTAAEVYKNIQVFKDLPAEDLDRVMTYMSGSLGVKCNFCHVPMQWEKDDKEEKTTAREMIKMTLAINKENFGGRNEVSCATCHNGKSHPQGMPVLGESLWARSNVQPTKETLPTIDEVLDKYVAAIGGKSAVEKISTRWIKGTRTDVDGSPVAEEVFVKSPDKMLMVMTYPKSVVSNGFDGTKGWWASEKGVDEMHTADAEQFKRDAQFFQPTRLKEIYKEMTVAGTDKLNEKAVYVVRATTQAGARERLYFDKQTGLLVRRYAASPLPIGVFPTIIDYDDYRAVEGVKMPYSIKWSIPGQSWSLKVSEVKQNTAIDDAKFNQPAK